jgi:hypothetical protein
VNPKPLLVIAAVLGLVLGLAFFLVPGRVVATFGTTADQAMQHMARNFGSAVLALGVMSWTARNAAASTARRAILLALLTYFSLGSISILLFQLTGIPNVLGWLGFAVHVPLALAFGYCLVAGRGSTDA